MAQVTEHLPSKYEALSSTPEYNQKKFYSQAWWYIPIILDTWEAEAWVSQIPGQSGQS
jgi:hypothetical protein